MFTVDPFSSIVRFSRFYYKFPIIKWMSHVCFIIGIYSTVALIYYLINHSKYVKEQDILFEAMIIGVRVQIQ